jgi:hypothetical protein
VKTYRCIHCDTVVGSDPDDLTAQRDAMAATQHGPGFCAPAENQILEHWCDEGRHWSDASRGQMRRAGDKWVCPGHFTLDELHAAYASYASGIDPYAYLASRAFKVPADQITQEQHKLTKVAVLASVYGASAFR